MVSLFFCLRYCPGFSYPFQGPERSEDQGDQSECSADKCHRVISQRGEDKSASQTSNSGCESDEQVVEALCACALGWGELIGQQSGAAHKAEIPAETQQK